MTTPRPAAKRNPPLTPRPAEAAHDASSELASVLREIHAGQQAVAPVIVGPGAIAAPAPAAAAGTALVPVEQPTRPYQVDDADKRELGDMIGFAVSKSCDAIAVRAGAHWKLERKEATDLGEAWAHVMLWYFPDFKLNPIWIAIIASGMTFGPRVAMQMQINQVAAERKAAAAKSGHDDKPKPVDPSAEPVKS